MGFNFKEAAKQAKSSSIIIGTRDKVKLEDLLFKYDNIVTIMGGDILPAYDKQSGEMTDFCAMICAEEPEKFFGVGIVLRRLFENWMNMCDGDIIALNEGLKNEGGVKLKITKEPNKKGYLQWNYEVMD